MKPLHLPQLIATAMLIGSPLLGYSQQNDVTKEVEKVIGNYFEAISKRDASAVRETLGEHFLAMDVVMDSGQENARVVLIDRNNGEMVLPPKGNDNLIGFRVSSVKTDFSDSNPTAALASFEITRPLSEKQREMFQKTLAIDPSAISQNSPEVVAKFEADQARLKKYLSEGQVRFSMLAMLGRQGGKWKIVCMSFP